MKFWTEYLLAWHRAIWFPVNWMLGLEAPAEVLPMNYIYDYSIEHQGGEEYTVYLTKFGNKVDIIDSGLSRKEAIELRNRLRIKTLKKEGYL